MARFFRRSTANHRETLIEESLQMAERAKRISNLEARRRYIDSIPDIKIRSSAMAIFSTKIENPRGRNIYIQSIQDDQWRFVAMAEFSFIIPDITDRINYIWDIHNIKIRSYAMTKLIPQLTSLEFRRSFINEIPDPLYRSNAMVNFAKENINDIVELRQYLSTIPIQSIKYEKLRKLDERQKLNITNFVNEMNRQLDLGDVTWEGLKNFFTSYQIPTTGLRRKKDYLDALYEYRKDLIKKRKTQKSAMQQIQQGFDFFGNQIKNPVLGNDGIIYDKSSLDKWFAENRIYQRGVSVVNPKIVGGRTPLFEYRELTPGRHTKKKRM